MTSTLVRHDLRTARDWAEIQERMLVPLYEAVYERLRVDRETRLLGLGCGSGLALLLAAARGARVVGTDTDEARLSLARARLSPEPQWGAEPWPVQLLPGGLEKLPKSGRYNLVTAFDVLPEADALAAVAARAERESPIVLASWGTTEPHTRAPARSGGRRTATSTAPQPVTPSAEEEGGGESGLRRRAHAAGLRVVDAGQVNCPFGYADVDSAVRGLLSTGRYGDPAHTAEESDVRRELTDALHVHLREDGTIWLPHLFHYVIACAW